MRLLAALFVVCVSCTVVTPDKQSTRAVLEEHEDPFNDDWIELFVPSERGFVTPPRRIRTNAFTTPPVTARPANAPDAPTKRRRLD